MGVKIEDLKVGMRLKIKKGCLESFHEPWCNLPIVTVKSVHKDINEFCIIEEESLPYNIQDIDYIVEEDEDIDMVEENFDDVEDVYPPAQLLEYILKVLGLDRDSLESAYSQITQELGIEIDGEE